MGFLKSVWKFLTRDRGFKREVKWEADTRGEDKITPIPEDYVFSTRAMIKNVREISTNKVRVVLEGLDGYDKGARLISYHSKESGFYTTGVVMKRMRQRRIVPVVAIDGKYAVKMPGWIAIGVPDGR